MSRKYDLLQAFRPALFLFLLLMHLGAGAQTVKILFDATKAEMAGNADWVIDADANTLGVSGSGAMLSGIGDESNPQGIPTPAQSGINASTTETYWTGALSAWAVDCAKRGYQVESLPYNDSITYGNSAHIRDLSHYTIFVVDEPNIMFTAKEKKAIVQFVKDGGRLFVIADHDVSDRNGDGYDSPTIWNDLFSTNSVQANPFGVSFDLQNFSQTSTNVANLPGDTCLHGPAGNVTKIQYSGGTSMTLNTTANPTVKGLIFKTGASNTGTTEVLFARAYYGSGKVCLLGDSSPVEDGTGDVNDILYNGYTGDAGGEHQLLLMNAMIWLAAKPTVPSGLEEELGASLLLDIAPNPADGVVHVRWHADRRMDVQFEIADLSGRVLVKTGLLPVDKDMQEKDFQLPAGMYVLKAVAEGQTMSRVVVVR